MKLCSKERWKVHPEGFYAVSTFGRIKQLQDTAKIKAGTILHPYENKGYLKISLRLKGKRSCWDVHVVVAETFHGPCPLGKEVNHKDGNKKNNTPKNLEYITHKKNIVHAYRNGLRIPIGRLGEPRAKLTLSKVTQIRKLAEKGYYQQEIADMFGVSNATISLIVRRKLWRDYA